MPEHDFIITVRSILEHSADLIDWEFLKGKLTERGLAEYLPVSEQQKG